MKASELISALRVAMQLYGDREVYIYTSPSGYEIADIDVISDQIAKPGNIVYCLEPKYQEE
jgi:hypothetical protein